MYTQISTHLFSHAGGDDKAATGDCAASISGVDGGGLDTEDVQPLANVQILFFFQLEKWRNFSTVGL